MEFKDLAKYHAIALTENVPQALIRAYKEGYEKGDEDGFDRGYNACLRDDSD